MLYVTNTPKNYETKGFEATIKDAAFGNPQACAFNDYSFTFEGETYEMKAAKFYLNKSQVYMYDKVYRLYVLKTDQDESPRYELRTKQYNPVTTIDVSTTPPEGTLFCLAEVYVYGNGKEFFGIVYNSTTDEEYWTDEMLKDVPYPFQYNEVTPPETDYDNGQHPYKPGQDRLTDDTTMEV